MSALNVLIALGLLSIAVQYFVICVHNRKNETAKPVLFLISLFVLSSICGFVPQIFKNFPEKIEFVTHAIFALCIYVYLLTNQARHIERTLKRLHDRSLRDFRKSKR